MATDSIVAPWDRSHRLALVLIGLVALCALVGASVVYGATTRNGGAVKGVRAAIETTPAILETDFDSALWTNVPGMSLTVGVPATEKALLVITFSSEVGCEQVAPYTIGSRTCEVRVVVDEAPVNPPSVRFYTGNGTTEWETNSMQFVAGPLNAGPHTVKVQYQVIQPHSKFTLGNRTLTILRSKV